MSGVVVARACGATDFGIYLLVMSVITFVTNLQTAAICTPYMFQRAGLSIFEDRISAGSALIHQLLLSVTTTVLVGALAITVPREWLGITFSPTLVAAATVVSMYLLKEFTRQFALAQRRATAALWTDSAVAAIQLSLLLALWSRGALSAPSAFVAIGIGSGVPAICFLYFHRDCFLPSWHASISQLISNWRFGRWVVAGFLVSVAASQLLPWALAALHGPAATAAYGAALSLATLALPLFTGASSYLAPRFASSLAQGGLERLRGAIGAPTMLYAAGMGAFSLVLLGSGKWLLPLTYGSEYSGGTTELSILSIAVLGTMVSTPLGIALMALRRADVNFRAGFGGLVLLCTLGLVLTRAWAAVGAAIALCVGNWVESGLKFWWYRTVIRQAGNGLAAVTIEGGAEGLAPQAGGR